MPRLLFISHDIALTRYISDYIAVMYLGRVVEYGTADDVIKNPQHPYTKALISNCASIDPEEKVQNIAIEGEPPTPLNPGPVATLNRDVIVRARHADSLILRK